MKEERMKSFITTLMIGVFAYPATAIMADVFSASANG